MNQPHHGYDAVLLDLDGTVIRGAEPVSEAPEVINELRRAGWAVQFMTNNASRTPEEVADLLTAVGIDAWPQEVATSAQAAADLLAARLAADSVVLVVGTEALAAAVQVAGLQAVTTLAGQPVAVVQGHSSKTGWAQLAEACLAIRAGALWIACNIDRTLPTERGLLPGNGAMVAALQAATDRNPTVAGKPERPMLDTVLNRIDARCPLVVGDRLDTDIAGARAAGMDSLLVLSGVADATALLACPPDQRPSHLGADLRVLRGSVDDARIQSCPGWRVEPADGALVLHSDGDAGDSLDALRTLCARWWAEHAGPVQVRAGDRNAATVMASVGLGEVLR